MSATAAASLVVCVGLLGGPLHPTPAQTVTLWWVHSVEKVRWIEQWTATGHGLVAGEARIRGSGAGMEPPPDARLIDGWYRYQPPTAPHPDLVLPDSDFTAPLMLCAHGACHPLAVWAARPPGDITPIRIAPCAPPSIRTRSPTSPSQSDP